MSLATHRATVSAALTAAGLQAFDHLPDRLAPPCAVIAGADPYLTSEGAPFGSVRMRLEVRLVTRPGANEQVITDLDALIEDAIAALDTTTWAVEEVSQPYNLVAGSASYLTTTLTINDDITLKEK